MTDTQTDSNGTATRMLFILWKVSMQIFTGQTVTPFLLLHL